MKCGKAECGAEGTAAGVNSRKSEWVLGRGGRNIAHLYGIAQLHPFCDPVPWLPQESMGKGCVQQTDPNPVRPSLVFHISSAKNACQKSICNCFHSCVFIMGSLIILHLVYEAVLVVFRFGLSMLTSVVQRDIHHHSAASEFHLGRVLPRWALWRCKPSPSNHSRPGPEGFAPGISEVKHAQVSNLDTDRDQGCT